MNSQAGPRRFLFLQGIATLFFARLGQRLVGLGQGVHRINFNAGDRLFWSLPGAVDYRDRPEAWRAFSLFNPVVYLINGFRWTFYGVSDVPVVASFALTAAFFGVCLAVVAWIFRTGYRLKT